MPPPSGSVARARRPLGGLVALSAPLALPRLVPLRALGPFAAWLLTSGRWLVVTAIALSVLSLAAAGSGRPQRIGRWAAERLDAIPSRVFTLALFAAAFLTMLALVPGHRWAGDGLLGDEPKYLRITESLYYDLDTDVGSGTRTPPTASSALRNVAWLARTTARSAVDLFANAEPPPHHVWRAGHLTIAGRGGGLYHLQPPGLPALLLPGFAVQRAIWPDLAAPWLPLLILAGLWAFGLAQGVRLAEEVSGSRAAGVIAGAIVASSAPVFLSGYHFYPEAAALAIVPWLIRAAIGTPAGAWAFLASGIAIGFLPWLHVKFSLAAAVLLALTARQAGNRRRLAALVAPAVALAAALGLYHHRITGLVTPDALYRRYDPETYGGLGAFVSADVIRGALIAFFGAVDGLFVMAPATIAGALAIVWVAGKDARAAAALAAVVAAFAAASAVHGGGAPGPPGRLMAPIACVFGAALAVGLARRCAPLRWTAIVLTLAGLSVTVTMHADWRRAVSPYRRMFASADSDFTVLLPGMPRRSREERLRPDIARGLALLAVVAFWAWRMSRAKCDLDDTRASSAAARWPALRDTHLAFWATIAAGTIVLRALGP